MIGAAGLTVRYGSLTALESVSVDFRKGEVAVLLGRSGAGKSTLLRCLNHLQRPTAGTVSVQAIGCLDNTRQLRRHRRQTGMIFQQHQLISHQTALKNVLAGRLGHYVTWRSLFPMAQADVDLALRCLDQVGLRHKALARADQLSGGERQRVGIARALCQEPVLLLADEPVASLDPITADEVLSQLCGVSRENHLTLIVSLHQLELARKYGERILGLAGGKVVFDGPPAALTPEHLRAIYPGGGQGEAASSAVPPQERNSTHAATSIA